MQNLITSSGLDTNTIFSIGGKSQQEKYINFCEEYNIKEDQWHPAASLNEKKQNISAAAFDCSIIFAFGGYNGHRLGTIEIYRPFVEYKWKIIKLSHNDGWSPRDQIGCIQISCTAIILFGGMDSANNLLDDTLIFNTMDISISKSNSKLKKKEIFCVRSIIRQENSICVFGFALPELHLFDIEQNLWKVMEEHEWKASYFN